MHKTGSIYDRSHTSENEKKTTNHVIINDVIVSIMTITRNMTRNHG